MAFAGTVHDLDRDVDRNDEPASVVAPRRCPALVTACALTLLTTIVSSGCSGGATTLNPESIRVEGVSASYEIPSRGSYVAPDGSAWIYPIDDELCVGLHAEPEAEPTCAPWDRSLSKHGVSWSNDAKAVLFTENPFERWEAADVSVFDIETGRIEALTDDATDKFAEPRADIDSFPFYGPGEQVYFFRNARDQGVTLYRIVDGNPEPVDGGHLGEGERLYGVPHPWGKNTWLYPYFEGVNRLRFATLTFDGSASGATVSIQKLSWTSEEQVLPVDWRSGTVVLLRVRFSNNNAAIVVRPEERTSSDLPVDDQTFREGFVEGALAVSTDGKHVLELRDDGDGTVRSTVWRIDTAGDVMTVEPIEVGTVTDERLDGGLRSNPVSVGWDGGTTLTAIGEDGVVVFDVTTG